MKTCINDTIFDRISAIVSEQGIEAYVIGGYVRDCILGREHAEKDIDIVVIGNGIDIATRVARSINPGIKITRFRNFGTAMFRYKNYELEFVGARKESYDRKSRKPAVENGTLADDQMRRDFTINALAISLNAHSYGTFLDPFGGMDDIASRTLRTPLDPDITFSDDPLRMMRAVRFASQLDFSIDPLTFESIKRNAERISIVSGERIIQEFNKVMLGPNPSTGLRLMFESGLLYYFFPELHNLKGVDIREDKAHKDNFDHTLQVVDNLSARTDDLYLRWAALLHDIAKPLTKRFVEGTGWTFHSHEFVGAKMVSNIFSRLKLPMNEKMRYVSKMVALHLRPISLSGDGITDSAIRRLLFDAGDDIDDLMMLCQADITSKNEKKVRKHIENFNIVRRKLVEIEESDHVRNFQPPVDGEEIIRAFGIGPGREIGIIKNAIKEAILDGDIHNDHKAARELMFRKGKEIGLTPVEKED
ncbi:MAG: HD domain-containing protein [Bacteroidia bacterium]|nr:MAG: HD domain-containing protein [Bacteroidia bacterium]